MGDVQLQVHCRDKKGMLPRKYGPQRVWALSLGLESSGLVHSLASHPVRWGLGHWLWPYFPVAPQVEQVCWGSTELACL